MYADPLFSEVVSSYKARYKSGIRESFSSYCRRRHVSNKSVSQWMYRRGMDVSSLRLEALLELSDLPVSDSPANADSFPLATLGDLFSGNSGRFASPKDPEQGVGDLLKGVSITFPDGVRVSIRSTTAQALEKLLSKYQLETPVICLP